MTKVYYKDEYVKLINGDCLEVMKKIPNEKIDLIVTDPPYIMDYQSNRRVVKEKFDKIKNDINSEDLISDYLAECYRILKNDTSIYVFCSWHKIDFFKQEFEKHFKLKNLIVWNKNNHGSGDLKGSYAPKHELILYGHKGRSLFREKRIPDVIDCDKISSAKLIHPTEKPLELLSIFIKNSSDIGDIVFDGFSGSSPTLVVCQNLKRKGLGVEIEKEYCKVSKIRLEENNNKIITNQ